MSIVMLVAQGRWVTRFLAMSIRFTGPLLDHTHLHDGNSFEQVIPAEAYCPNRRVNHDTIPVTTTNRVLLILLCDQPTSTSLSARVGAPFSATIPFLGKTTQPIQNLSNEHKPLLRWAPNSNESRFRCLSVQRG